MNLALLFFAIDCTAIVCAAVIAARVLASFPRQLNAQLVVLILLNTACSIVLSRDDYAYWIPPAFDIEVGAWRPVMNLLRNATPGLFMILAHRLFVDGSRLPRSLVGLFALQMVLEEPAGWFLSMEAPVSRLLEETTPSLLQLLFVGAALYWCIADWRNDLINVRRRTRAVLLVIVGVQTIASSLLLRVVIAPNTIANYYAHEAMIAFGAAISIFILMRISRPWLAEHLQIEVPSRAETPRAASSPQGEPEETVRRLKALFEVEKVYLETDLTLLQLAKRMQLPEYRLRSLIHEQLGYRNFNALLHAYRVREACEHLTDPAQARTPILTIALSVGYGSINTFNRGFREVMGTTPSAFRSRERSGSLARPVGQTSAIPEK